MLRVLTNERRVLPEAGQHLIEHVVVALLGGVGDDPALLQQILSDLSPGDYSALRHVRIYTLSTTHYLCMF